jgi:hypothetical protein
MRSLNSFSEEGTEVMEAPIFRWFSNDTRYQK